MKSLALSLIALLAASPEAHSKPPRPPEPPADIIEGYEYDNRSSTTCQAVIITTDPEQPGKWNTRAVMDIAPLDRDAEKGVFSSLPFIQGSLSWKRMPNKDWQTIVEVTNPRRTRFYQITPNTDCLKGTPVALPKGTPIKMLFTDDSNQDKQDSRCFMSEITDGPYAGDRAIVSLSCKMKHNPIREKQRAKERGAKSTDPSSSTSTESTAGDAR
jgi:hypothetical protein